MLQPEGSFTTCKKFIMKEKCGQSDRECLSVICYELYEVNEAFLSSFNKDGTALRRSKTRRSDARQMCVSLI